MSERSGRRLDMLVIAAGGLASGGVALGTALLLEASVSTEGVRPTAATLSDAFSLLSALPLAWPRVAPALPSRHGRALGS